MQDCSGRDFQQPIDDAFHFDVVTNPSRGYIEEMRLKPNHVFDVSQLTIWVNPIVCQSGKYMYLSQREETV